jgi:hypothetical protein
LSKEEKTMTEHNLPTAEDAADFAFDGTQLAAISAEDCAFEKLEWGSDVHIAFLKQAISGLQEALADAEAVRAQASE